MQLSQHSLCSISALWLCTGRLVVQGNRIRSYLPLEVHRDLFEGEGTDDGEDAGDEDDGSSEASSDGIDKLVLFPTLLLSATFVLCLCYRCYRSRNEMIAFDQVDQMLADFEDESSYHSSSISGSMGASIEMAREYSEVIDGGAIPSTLSVNDGNASESGRSARHPTLADDHDMI